MAEPDVTKDAFFDGRLILTQPATGHRSGTDAVLLAAAAPRDFDGFAVDAGAGVGAVGLGVAMACPLSRLHLIERDRDTVALAAANIAANGLEARVTAVGADLLSREERWRTLPEAADLVLTNPPFYEAGRVRASLTRRDAAVMAAGTRLEDWLVACLDLLTPRGTLIVIHVPAVLPDLLAALERRAGGVVVKCIHPRAGSPAHRILVRATKGSRAPLSIAPPLVLHGTEGFTPEADVLHGGYGAITWA